MDNLSSDDDQNSTGDSIFSRRYGNRFLSVLSFFSSPVASLIDYSGLLRLRPDQLEAQPLVTGNNSRDDSVIRTDSPFSNRSFSLTGRNSSSGGNGEVSIRIVGTDEGTRVGSEDEEGVALSQGSVDEDGVQEMSLDSGASVDSTAGGGSNNRNASEESSYQRYDIQQLTRWAEQILPFSLLLLLVFIRQHLQGFVVTIWFIAFLFKSNDILKKQTALKGERKLVVLFGYLVVFILHVSGVYYWYQKDDLYLPLFLVPPKSTPHFWHAIFISLVNDTMVRLAAMSLKMTILIYYRNGKGHNFRRQSQMLTMVEYTLLLYRALIPAPVWYKFFLNKDNGNIFSSLITGLYLTFKLTSMVEKVRSFMAALKALSRSEIHYGSYATVEQANAAGGLCAICQEKMHAPVLLRCQHIFCQDCVSQWFESERTCPLCRAVVRPTGLRSYGDGSTSHLVQIC